MTPRSCINAIATWLLVGAFIITVLWVAATHLKAEPPLQRFVRVGWDLLDNMPSGRYTVMDTVKDTKTGTCRAFYRVEYPTESGYDGRPTVALAEFGPINCDGQVPVIIPIPISPIK